MVGGELASRGEPEGKHYFVWSGLGGFDELVVYNNDADPHQLLAVFYQTLCRVE